MDFKLQTLHFNATEQLTAYINKKTSKIEKYPDIESVELTLKVVKPETANNKEAAINLKTRGRSFHAEKVADTFEEAIDLCIDVVRRELEKIKENRG